MVNNIERFKGLFAAALVGLFVALLALFLALAGVISMALTQIVLAIAFIIGAVFISWEVLPGSARWLKIVVVCGLGIALVTLDWWALKQKRSHLYISRTQFSLEDDSPQGTQNFANVVFRNESDLDFHYKQLSRVTTDDTFPDDVAKQREVEDRLFAGMLERLHNTENAPDLELPAHGETYMSSPVSLPRSMISIVPKALYFMGRIIYTDQNGTHHTDFCTFIHSKPQPIFYCKGHNEAP